MIYDTNVLIAIQGRNKRFSRAAAIAWLKQEDDGIAYIPRMPKLSFYPDFPLTKKVRATCIFSLFCPFPSRY